MGKNDIWCVFTMTGIKFIQWSTLGEINCDYGPSKMCRKAELFIIDIAWRLKLINKQSGTQMKEIGQTE